MLIPFVEENLEILLLMTRVTSEIGVVRGRIPLTAREIKATTVWHFA